MSVAIALHVADVELVRWAPSLTNEPKSDSSRWHLRVAGAAVTLCGEDLAGVVVQSTATGVLGPLQLRLVCLHCARARLRRLLAR